MFRNFLKVTLRNLIKNKLFVIINTLGMGITLACCIVAYLNYDYNQGFDLEHVKADEIYRINFIREYQGNSRKYGYIPRPLGANIQENIPDVDEVIRMIPSGGNIRIKDELFGTNLAYVDPGFFKVFTFEFVAGNASDFSNKSNIYITDELAKTYFGDEDPIGKPIIHVLDSGVLDYTVAGVFKKKPSNSSFMFTRAVTLYDNYFDVFDEEEEDDWSNFGVAFVQVVDKNRIPTITEQLQNYVEPQNLSREDFQVTRYYLDPFEGMAIRTEAEDVGNWGVREGMPLPAVTAPMIMAGLLLLLACINFTNTSIAMSGRRLKEIGLRKVMGGRQKQLIAQFLGENVLLCLLAFLVSLLIAEFLVPAYSRMWDFIDIELVYSDNLNIILFLVSLLVITGVFAGGYPAFYISKFEATNILKGTTKFGGTNKFTKVLLGGQFLISMLAIISSVGFIQNAKFQDSIDLGYEGEEVLYVNINGESEYNVYRNALEGNSDITNIAGSEHQIMEFYRNDPLRYEDVEREVDMYSVGDNFMETMEIELLDGRSFIKDSETDRLESVIVTQTVADEFGWAEPLGKRLVWRDTVQLHVIGLIKDLYTSALWDPLDPALLMYSSEENYNYLTVRASSGTASKVNEFMKTQWAGVFPNRIYSGEYLNDELEEAKDVNINIVKMFIFLGLVATFLSALGLYSLVALNIMKRMKEIGVRKVLGAKIGNIALVVNKQFLIIMLVASILGSVAGYYMTTGLMQQIWAYYINLGVDAFILSLAVLFFVSLLTVGYKIYTAANVNPAYTLRNE